MFPCVFPEERLRWDSLFIKKTIYTRRSSVFTARSAPSVGRNDSPARAAATAWPASQADGGICGPLAQCLASRFQHALTSLATYTNGKVAVAGAQRPRKAAIRVANPSGFSYTSSRTNTSRVDPSRMI